MTRLVTVFKWAFPIAVIWHIVSGSWSLFFDYDRDPKVNLSTLYNADEKAALTVQYTGELFAMAKRLDVNRTGVEKLINSGIDINSCDEEGRTPLFYAVIMKNAEMTGFLLYRGADASIKDNFGWRPIDYTDRQKDAALYVMLLDHDIQAQAEENGYSNITISHTLDANKNIIKTEVGGQLESSWSPLMKAIKISIRSVGLFAEPWRRCEPL